MDQLRAIFSLLSDFITVGGGAWLAWGLVVVGFGINERNGAGIKDGILQVVGGGVILAAGLYLRTI